MPVGRPKNPYPAPMPNATTASATPTYLHAARMGRDAVVTLTLDRTTRALMGQDPNPNFTRQKLNMGWPMWTKVRCLSSSAAAFSAAAFASAASLEAASASAAALASG